MEMRYIAVKNALAARHSHAVTSQDSSKVTRFEKVSVLVSAILSAQSIGSLSLLAILSASVVNKPGVLEQKLLLTAHS